MGSNFVVFNVKDDQWQKSSTNIKIPKSYATSGFLVFLCVEDSNGDSELYSFLEADIEQWKKSSSEEYFKLDISADSYREDLKPYQFDDLRVDLIKTLIKDAETSGEFKKLLYGIGDITLPTLTASGAGVTK